MTNILFHQNTECTSYGHLAFKEFKQILIYSYVMEESNVVVYQWDLLT